jgi:hypothetical protein
VCHRPCEYQHLRWHGAATFFPRQRKELPQLPAPGGTQSHPSFYRLCRSPTHSEALCSIWMARYMARLELPGRHALRRPCSWSASAPPPGRSGPRVNPILSCLLLFCQLLDTEPLYYEAYVTAAQKLGKPYSVSTAPRACLWLRLDVRVGVPCRRHGCHTCMCPSLLNCVARWCSSRFIGTLLAGQTPSVSLSRCASVDAWGCFAACGAFLCEVPGGCDICAGQAWSTCVGS